MQYISRYRSPLGEMLLAADEIGLTGLWFAGQKHFARRLDREHEESGLPLFDAAKRWLDVYFSGREPDVAVPLHFTGTAFENEVWEAPLRHPLRTDDDLWRDRQQLAARRGLPRMSAQAVGGAVGRNGDLHHRALPPRRGGGREPDRLCGRHREKGAAAGARARGPAAVLPPQRERGAVRPAV